MAQNIENQTAIVSDFFSEYSQMSDKTKVSKISKHSKFQYKMNLDNWKQKVTEAGSQENHLLSNYYLAEIKFDSQLSLYKSTIQQISDAHKRLNLYFNLASVNKETVLSKIFAKKYETFQIYYKSLLTVKELIEK